MRPLLLTMGDPTGVGPELIVKTLLNGDLESLQRPLEVVGDSAVLAHAAQIFGQTAEIEETGQETVRLTCTDRHLLVHSVSRLTPKQLIYGQPDRACGQAMVAYIETALARCRSGEAAGMITAPISKAAINTAGCHFPGHTELLAERCGVDKVVMMLAGERLKVALVTTHLAYRDVPGALSTKEILATIRITDRSLRTQFGIPQPKLAVLGLNPHSGENGLFGDEERRLISPAIEQAIKEEVAATGPHSADTLFHFAARGAYDAVICMYHDQGLIPLKLLHFDDAVNVTLGLPIVRTSVDHGTAYDLAGSGRASHASLIAALKLADRMAVPQS